VTWVLWNLVSICLETVSAQERCTICAKHTIGLDIILDAPNDTSRSRGSSGSSISMFGENLILMQDRCMVCAKHIAGSEIILDAPDKLLGDVGHVKSRFGPFGDSVQIGAQFARNVPLAQKSLWTHPMVLLDNEARVEARFGPFGYSVNLDAR
jgi:hypothetical protein